MTGTPSKLEPEQPICEIISATVEVARNTNANVMMPVRLGICKSRDPRLIYSSNPRQGRPRHTIILCNLNIINVLEYP